MKNYSLLFIALFTILLNGQSINNSFELGDKAPLIQAVDQNENSINTIDILKEEKILLIFYRGYWCPHCRKHLGSLQDKFNEFSSKGVYVMVVTPEKVEKTKLTADKIKAKFSIVHDVDNKIMKDYKVAFEVNEENVTNYYDLVNRRLSEYNVENNNVLPVPATFLIDTDGTIIYKHFDPNYKKRSDLEEILKML